MPSTLAPLTELVVLMLPDSGVCGGVVRGSTPPMLLLPEAERLGTLPRVGVGLLRMVVVRFVAVLVVVVAEGGGVIRAEDCVATEEIELDRVGLAARIVVAGEAGGTVMGVLEEDNDLAWDGAWMVFGVGSGVEAGVLVPLGVGWGWVAVGTTPV